MTTHVRVKPLLEADLSVKEIARKVGVTPPTVCCHARRLGYEGDSRSRYDWAAARAFHDQGATYRECRLRFGFSAGAWHSAVQRGELTPRAPAAPLDHLQLCLNCHSQTPNFAGRNARGRRREEVVMT